MHRLLGHSRRILQMDVGGMPHEAFLRSIELLSKKVLPKIRKELDRERMAAEVELIVGNGRK